jgi:DNA-binding NarL/FixJ family response regulator
MTMPPIRIVLADDHLIVRNGIKMLVEGSDIEIVAEVSNGQEAIQAVKDFSPDIILMDISMPLMNGLEATRVIKKDFPNTQSLILSMYDSEEYIMSAINSGAIGYLLKDAPKEEILSAILTVARGEKYFNNSVSNIIIGGLMKTKNDPNSKNSQSLSKKEKVILKYIVDGKSSREIAEKLLLSVRTVDNHRANMMKKLEVKNAIELVRKAMRHKLV